MAIYRHLVLAALVSCAFSAHAQSTATSQLQTYMPRAVEGFFMFTAPTAPATAPVLLGDSGQAAAAAPSAQLRPTPDVVQAPPDAGLADFGSVGTSADLMASLKTDLPPDVNAGLSGGVTGDAALAPTVALADAVEANALPEPGSGGLMLAGLAGVGFMARRRRSR